MSPAPALGAAGEWLLPLQRSSDPELSLICLPYAGGSAAVFRDWRRRLPAAVDAFAVQLPGRASRLREPARSSLAELARELALVLRPQLAGPTVLAGHSMGGLLAFELARELRRRGDRPPVGLVICAARAGHLPGRTRMHELPRDALIEQLRRLGGMAPQILCEPELLDLVLPTLRADLRAAETYLATPEPPLEVPIAAFAGLHDEHFRVSDVEAWRQHTRAAFTFEVVPGGHFFIHDHDAPFLERLGAQLEAWSR